MSDTGEVGHNSEGATGEVDSSHLRAFIERIEVVESDIADRVADRKEIYAEARANGFDPRIMRKVISLRKMDRDKRAEEEAVLDLYLNALGED